MFVCVCVCVLVLIVCQQVATKGTYKCISVAAILACAPPPPPRRAGRHSTGCALWLSCGQMDKPSLLALSALPKCANPYVASLGKWGLRAPPLSWGPAVVPFRLQRLT